ncbi:MAG: CBS domain-containing protein [Nitrospira sp.]
MERITLYGKLTWYLFNVSSLLVVMRWVIQSIGLAPPPPLVEQIPQDPIDQFRSAESHDVDPEDSRQEGSVALPTCRADERFTGRDRMVEAWASRCRLVSVDKETDIQSAARQLLDGTSRGLLVVDGRSGETVGVLQERDLVRALGEHGAHLGRMRVGDLVDMPR